LYDLWMTPALVDPSSTRPSTNLLLLSPNAVGPGTESPEAFFTTALGSSEEKEQVKRLLGIAQTPSKPSDGLYKRFWSGRSRIFQSELGVSYEAGPIPKTAFEAEVADRLRRLKQARQNIGRKDWEADRFWLVFLAHEVEYISQSVHIDPYTSQGVNSSSAARKMVERYLDTVGDDYKRCSKVVQVLKEGGPASLLVVGRST
jgi:hypothetical protein